MDTIITSLPLLNQAKADAWVYGLIVCGMALAIAITIVFMIPWRSDNKDYGWRRICFIVIGLALPAGLWLYNTQEIANHIPNSGFRNMFQETNLCVLLTSIAIYTVVGICLMFCFRRSKLGSILGKIKN